ncbi:MAG: hypothetical protein LCH92_09295 [Proteobacteria bacterium]|nr:hypothetical protein [Pseudomonadota bacterium]
MLHFDKSIQHAQGMLNVVSLAGDIVELASMQEVIAKSEDNKCYSLNDRSGRRIVVGKASFDGFLYPPAPLILGVVFPSIAKAMEPSSVCGADCVTVLKIVKGSTNFVTDIAACCKGSGEVADRLKRPFSS